MPARFLLTLTLALLLLSLPACYRLQHSQGGGQLSYQPEERRLNPSDILLPDGYTIEVVSSGLTFPTAAVQDEEGTLYVIESGYAYGEVFLPPRLLEVQPDGSTRTLTEGSRNGPWTGITYHDNYFYVAEGGVLEGGRILRIARDGTITPLAKNLPSLGDHHTNGPVVKDGYVYFGQGTATNSGVVGKDNADYGWLSRQPEFHDIPCKDLILKGVNYTTANVLTENPDDEATTGAYVPFGQTTTEGQVIKGQIPCNGAIMRVPLSGGAIELVAWGLRNPYGLALAPSGDLYLTENSYDVRGSRPVWGTADVLWKVEPGTWYGWPDFNAGHSLEHLEVPGEDAPKPLLAQYPNEPSHPVAALGVHSSSNGFSFSASERFGHQGQAFVAQFGDMAPAVGKVWKPVGYKVVRVDVETGVVKDFAVNKGKRNGPASWLQSGGLERPISVSFSADGSQMFVVDFGIMTMRGGDSHPKERTGVIWVITKQEKQ